jgi:hypothetical protein
VSTVTTHSSTRETCHHDIGRDSGHIRAAHRHVIDRVYQRWANAGRFRPGARAIGLGLSHTLRRAARTAAPADTHLSPAAAAGRAGGRYSCYVRSPHFRAATPGAPGRGGAISFTFFRTVL